MLGEAGRTWGNICTSNSSTKVLSCDLHPKLLGPGWCGSGVEPQPMHLRVSQKSPESRACSGPGPSAGVIPHCDLEVEHHSAASLALDGFWGPVTDFSLPLFGPLPATHGPSVFLPHPPLCHQSVFLSCMSRGPCFI